MNYICGIYSTYLTGLETRCPHSCLVGYVGLFMWLWGKGGEIETDEVNVVTSKWDMVISSRTYAVQLI